MRTAQIGSDLKLVLQVNNEIRRQRYAEVMLEVNKYWMFSLTIVF